MKREDIFIGIANKVRGLNPFRKDGFDAQQEYNFHLRILKVLDLEFKDAEIVFKANRPRFRYTLTHVASRLGISDKTIMRMEKSGVFRKPKRDWRGWRCYTEENVQEMLKILWDRKGAI